MIYVIFVHLYDYVYDVKVGTAFIDIPGLATIGDACMGLFTFSSGYLLGSKYKFGKHSVLATFAQIGPQRASGVRIVALRPCCCFEPRRAIVEL